MNAFIFILLQREERMHKLVLDKDRQRQVAREELAMLGVDRDVKECTFHIQAEHKTLGA